MLKNKGFKDWVIRNMDLAVLPVAFVLITLIMGSFNPEKFFSIRNARSIAFQLPELGLFSLAMMIAMITGGINLSIISSSNLSNVLMALAMTRLIPADSQSQGFAVLAIILGGLLVSALLGLLNGVFIAYVGVSPVLTTVGTMFFYEGLTLTLTKGYVISGFPEVFQAIGNNTWLGIPIPFFLFLLGAFVLWFVFRGTPFGHYLFMIGSNKRAVEFSGIDIKKVLVKAYVLSGVYAGLAGLVMTARFNSANARYGSSYVLVSVLVSVLGGADPDGGYGKISGVIIALLTLQVLTSGLNFMKVSSFVTIALWGVLLVLVIAYRRFAIENRDRWLSKNAL